MGRRLDGSRSSRPPRRPLTAAALLGAVTGAVLALATAHVQSSALGAGEAPRLVAAATTVPGPAAALGPGRPMPPTATALPPTAPPVAPVAAAPPPPPAAPPTARPPAPRPWPAATVAPSAPRPQPVTLSGPASQVIALVNQDRAAAGLAPLTMLPALSRAAAVHAGQDAQADTMTHDGLIADVNAQGVSWSSLGECLGWETGSPDPAYINQLWMASSEHRPIILGAFTAVGAGWAQSASGKWYVSLIVIS